jgi:hypothetical protein
MRVRIAIAFSAVAVVTSFATMGWYKITDNQRVDRLNQLVSNIQEQRVANTLAACLDQNASNTRIKRQLGDLIPGKATARQREIIRKLASAISPRRNCERVVRAKTGMKSKAKVKKAKKKGQAPKKRDPKPSPSGTAPSPAPSPATGAGGQQRPAASPELPTTPPKPTTTTPTITSPATTIPSVTTPSVGPPSEVPSITTPKVSLPSLPTVTVPQICTGPVDVNCPA